ncbi:MAG TPA: recombinase family protein [Terriglobales bacterium]|nr:recombinase family protein [Terriglobales bacterium]
MSVPAAQYLRMSTEQQQYSLINQAATIARYAEAHGFEIVRTYLDEARSGLVLRERAGLQQLLRDVVSPDAGYKAILVYDVSRWGRFQDTDEAAHYEFICKSSGVPVNYCAETFANDNSMPSLIMKSLKRVMAGEYSRELSVKVYEGQKRVVNLGFKIGCAPGYGFRRMLVSRDRIPKYLLNYGERKAIQSDHVILVHGPAEEVEVVREIYRLAAEDEMLPTAIARHLNNRGVPFLNGRKWYFQAVSRILTQPKYMGSTVFGKRTQRLGEGVKRLPPDEWIIVPNTHAAIVSQELFDKAQAALRNRTFYRSDEELLGQMRAYLEHHGLNAPLSGINTVPGAAHLHTFIERFGSIGKLCERLGIDHTTQIARSERRRKNLMIRSEIMEAIVRADPNRVAIVAGKRFQKSYLRLKRRGTVGVVTCVYFTTKSGEPRWRVTPASSDKKKNRVLLLCLFDSSNQYLERFFVIQKRIRPRTEARFHPGDRYLRSSVELNGISDLYDAVGRLTKASTRAERLAANLKGRNTRLTHTTKSQDPMPVTPR